MTPSDAPHPEVTPPGSPRPAADKLFLALVALLLPLMLWLSQDFGVTWDEFRQQNYGRLVYDYFASGFADHSALRYHNLYLYGGLFDLLCVVFQKLAPGLNEYDARHLVNALFGWGCIAFAGLLARRLFGSLAGALCVVFLALSPRFFGHCMNNPKDAPYAAFATMALYCLSFMRPQHPYLSWSRALAACGAVALALNVRVAGLLFLGYAGLLLGAMVLRDTNRTAGGVARVCLGFAALAAAAVVLGTAFWPWGQQNPLTRPFEALVEMSRFSDVQKFQILYDGRMTYAKDLPWTYVLNWVWMTTPLTVLLGGLGSLALLASRRLRLRTVALWFTVGFPVVYVIAAKSTLYDDYRHLLFIYPPFAALAAGGWSQAFSLLRKKAVVVGLALLLALGFADSIRFHVGSHPYQGMYFNRLAGGVQGAWKRYEIDYWGNCYREAMAWVEDQSTRRGRPMRVFPGGAEDLVHLNVRDPAKVRITYGADFDYYVTYMRKFTPEEADRALAEDTLAHTVSIDGVPQCILVEPPEKLRQRLPTGP